ncbi:hypothetical protein D9756_005787 [Leucocoprinus leucothites]|uniref:Uncharacterized protein n=1 Tax=Leucocoprinus leucothites TaxID=201217 RepID=A0A8H5D6U8_9AGAR|nr:hypothetical protein D9756_005787 [Leucoagaricus leucothites]
MPTQNPLGNRRSSTGYHNLLPAFQPNSAVPVIPRHSLLTWTFGRGSVIWRIWPAVLLHTAFAAVIVTLTMRGFVDLKIPSVMLTVLGVVIGFVISYRASSGNVRTIGRLIWFHVPPRLTPQVVGEAGSAPSKRSVGEMKRVMAEKKMALELVEGFAVALKHHVRGELGIYYQDLYHLVKPLHDHEHLTTDYRNFTTKDAAARQPRPALKRRTEPAPEPIATSTEILSPTSISHIHFKDPVIPSINSYGTFDPSHLHPRPRTQRSLSNSSASSSNDGHLPLLASTQPPSDTSLLSKVSGDLIPFSGVLDAVRSFFSTSKRHSFLEGDQNPNDPRAHRHSHRSWQGPVYSTLHTKHRPLAVSGGQNLPVEILRHISDWFSVLEDRGTVPGASMGQMIGALAAMEDNLTTLERILTTPLPFVYSVHIRTVWIYLFFLPFQLVDGFGWFTIPGVAIAAFIYLGFVAAGEEIEQPFGYDENDLDLDLFCREIIHNEMKHLKETRCANAYLGPELEDHPNVVHRYSIPLVALASQHAEESS